MNGAFEQVKKHNNNKWNLEDVLKIYLSLQ